jgi:hypothetical protein
MDRPFCGIQLSPLARGESEAGCPAPLFTPNRKHVPEMSISIRVRPASFAADIHITGIFIHIAGIRIHIRPESLFTSLRNQYSHRPEYAQIAGSLEGTQYWRRRNQDELTVKWIADATPITSDIAI